MYDVGFGLAIEIWENQGVWYICWKGNFKTFQLVYYTSPKFLKFWFFGSVHFGLVFKDYGVDWLTRKEKYVVV